MNITERLDTITAQLEKILSILGEESKASEDSSQNGSLIKGKKTVSYKWALAMLIVATIANGTFWLVLCV